MDNTLIQPSLEDLAYSDLLSYIRYEYPNYKIGKHHVATADHLMAVESQQITRLQIFEPPRHGKTYEIQYFIAWYIGRNPSKQIIYATYSQMRANDVGREVRNLLLSEFHEQIFPDCKISADSKSVNKISTQQHGNLFSVGVGAAVTGRGADLLLIDDPVRNREEAESKIQQSKLKDWFQSTAYTRLMPGRSGIIIVNTRWHENDLSGWTLRELKHEPWHVLSLPAIAEPGDFLGREPGEALWPDSYDEEALEQIKLTVGTREWSALYQQRPVDVSGALVKLDWIQRFDLNEMPKFNKIVISWDTAYKAKQINDPSAATVWGITKNGFYLIDVINKRMEYPDLKKETIRLYEKYRPSALLVEDKASGQSLCQELKNSTRIPVIPINPDADKITRFNEITAFYESGKVYHPMKASWLVDYEMQITRFPHAPHDDMADSTSQFLRWAGKPKYKRLPQSKLFWK